MKSCKKTAFFLKKMGRLLKRKRVYIPIILVCFLVVISLAFLQISISLQDPLVLEFSPQTQIVQTQRNQTTTVSTQLLQTAGHCQASCQIQHFDGYTGQTRHITQGSLPLDISFQIQSPPLGQGFAPHSIYATCVIEPSQNCPRNLRLASSFVMNTFSFQAQDNIALESELKQTTVLAAQIEQYAHIQFHPIQEQIRRYQSLDTTFQTILTRWNQQLYHQISPGTLASLHRTFEQINASLEREFEQYHNRIILQNQMRTEYEHIVNQTQPLLKLTYTYETPFELFFLQLERALQSGHNNSAIFEQIDPIKNYLQARDAFLEQTAQIYNTSASCEAFHEQNITTNMSEQFCTPRQRPHPQWNLTARMQEIPTKQETQVASVKPIIEQCCYSGVCQVCQEQTPILLIHGHLFNENNDPAQTLQGFTLLQRSLTDLGYMNGGILDPRAASQLQARGFPITKRASYYYITTYSVGELQINVQTTERIENYALRLREIIEQTKQIAGAQNVTIIAHSMGGLVAREYLTLFGHDDVDTLILIGTPNFGIEGRVSQVCPIFGSQRECDDMRTGSVFLQRLNNNPRSIIENKTFMIYGTGCNTDGQDGDGIVSIENAQLPGATNIQINGTCTDRFSTSFHSQMTDPRLYPQVLTHIQQIITR
ncbi:MAG: esterase/lipase family protein [Candidatus Woesearchaeota archaeon]